MLADVEEKLRRGNQVLFDSSSPCLWEFCRSMEKMHRKNRILWALVCAEEMVAEWEQAYPQELRPRQALWECRRWAAGEIKMPQAKAAILACHAAAKDLQDPWAAAMCHAIGQGGSTIHVGRHALGIPIYYLTALVRRNPEDYESRVLGQVARYLTRMDDWERADISGYTWAKFLQKEEKIPGEA